MTRARVAKLLGAGTLVGIVLVAAANLYVIASGHRWIVDAATLTTPAPVMILGAAVHRDGSLSLVLRDRLDTAIDLYRRGLATRLLVTGDHRKESYNEVGAMVRHLKEMGIPDEAIVVDHAGFDTYSSMYRALHVFGATRIVVVTQAFHLTRSLYLAHALGLDATGVVADRHAYHLLPLREMGARCKAIFDLVRGKQPMFPGPPEPGLL